MPEVLENPVLKEGDAEEAALMAAAQKADAEGFQLGDNPAPSVEIDSADHAAEGKEQEPAPKVESDNAEASAEPARDELGRFTKADGTKSEPNEAIPKKEPVLNTPAPPDQKTESAYERAKKDQERLNRNRQEFEQEKARERARIQAEREQIERERQQLQAPKPDTFTSKQYEEAAADFRKLAREQMSRGETEEAAGNFDLATKASEAAVKARENEQKTQFEQQKGGFEQTWRANMDATIKEIPELADRESPLAKELVQLFQQEPVFNYLPDGFKKAAEIAKLRLAAAKASALEDETKQLKAELQKYQKLTSVSGSSPTRHASAKRFEDMTESEMEAFLDRQSELAGGIQAA